MHTGSRYEETKQLPLKEITKLIRAEFTRLKKAGECPSHYKLSVRHPHASSIYLALTWDTRKEVDLSANDFATPTALALIERMEVFAEQFNYDRSDLMTDYHCTRFYLSSRVGWEQSRDVSNSLKSALGISHDLLRKLSPDAVRIVQDAYLEGYVNPSMGVQLAAAKAA